MLGINTLAAGRRVGRPDRLVRLLEPSFDS